MEVKIINSYITQKGTCEYKMSEIEDIYKEYKALLLSSGNDVDRAYDNGIEFSYYTKIDSDIHNRMKVLIKKASEFRLYAESYDYELEFEIPYEEVIKEPRIRDALYGSNDIYGDINRISVTLKKQSDIDNLLKAFRDTKIEPRILTEKKKQEIYELIVDDYIEELKDNLLWELKVNEESKNVNKVVDKIILISVTKKDRNKIVNNVIELFNHERGRILYTIKTHLNIGQGGKEELINKIYMETVAQERNLDYDIWYKKLKRRFFNIYLDKQTEEILDKIYYKVINFIIANRLGG